MLVTFELGIEDGIGVFLMEMKQSDAKNNMNKDRIKLRCVGSEAQQVLQCGRV